jgi:hypothetical protein
VQVAERGGVKAVLAHLQPEDQVTSGDQKLAADYDDGFSSGLSGAWADAGAGSASRTGSLTGFRRRVQQDRRASADPAHRA